MESKILIIDDEENLVTFLEDILSELNDEDEDSYTIKKAYNAADGINIAMDFKPDAVLLDLKLPDSPGTEVLSKLKQKDEDVQVIIMTAHASIETAARSVREKAYDYIRKPLPSKDHLKILVKNALERRQLLLDKKILLSELFEANKSLEIANRTLQDEKSLVDQKLQNKIKELSRLNKFSQLLLQYNDVASAVEEILKEVVEITDSLGAMFILKEGKDKKLFVQSTSGDVSLSAGDQIEEGKEPFGLIDIGGPWETEEYICSPLTFGDEELGVLAIRKGEKKISPGLVQAITSNISICLHNAMLYDTLKASYVESILSLIMVEESVNPAIKAHSERVSELSLKIADALGLPDRMKKNIRFSALLHDLGKIGREMVESEKLTTKIISPFKFLRRSRNILEHLRENYDGSGKPDKLSGNNIPIGSRIVRVSNRVDELLSEGKSSGEVIGEIEGKSGSLYDPRLVQVLKEIL
ncbi:MAG: response regulator [candidate division WOR-3 bacterium]|nr:response regulator [candidate division WOR-3 bacterium]